MNTTQRVIKVIIPWTASFLPLLVLAQAPQYENPIRLQINGQAIDSIPMLLVALVDGFVALMTPIIVAAIIYAGFLFVTAQGDTGKISTARFVLTWTLIGAGVLLGAKVISYSVQGTVDAFR